MQPAWIKNMPLIVATLLVASCTETHDKQVEPIETITTNETPTAKPGPIGLSSPTMALMDFDTTLKASSELLSAENYEEAKRLVLSFAGDRRHKKWDRIRILDQYFGFALRHQKLGLYEAFHREAMAVDLEITHFLQAWYINYDVAQKAGADSMALLARQYPLDLNKISISKIWRAIRQLRNDGKEDQVYDLLCSLKDIGYSGFQEAGEPQYLFLELVREHLKRGRVEEALEIAALDLTGTAVLLDLWHDRDFEPLWEDLQRQGKFSEDRLKEAAITQAEAASYRAKNLGLDEFMESATWKIQAYRGAGKLAQAESDALQILELLPSNKLELEYYAWLTNELAYVYESQGRESEALGLMATLANEDLHTHSWLINQVINYSSMLVGAGKFDEAIAVADRVIDGSAKSYASDYGKYWAASSKVCALVHLSRLDEAKAAFENMRSKPEENFAATTKAGLCLEEMDLVASLYITRLQDETQRDQALLALSTFAADGKDTNGADLFEKTQVIAQRPDVRAAVDKVGRLGNWSLRRDYWGEF